MVRWVGGTQLVCLAGEMEIAKVRQGAIQDFVKHTCQCAAGLFEGSVGVRWCT